MRFLKLVIVLLAYAFISPAFAQTCCPAGCVQNAPNQCVTIGPVQNSCGNTITCPRPPSGGSGGTGTGETRVTYPTTTGPQCWSLNPTQAMVDDKTNQCVNNLTANAMFWGCVFEDAAGKAEDERTGLSCAERQAALAKQCRKRCADFASASTRKWCVGRGPDVIWNEFFGDISGDVVGSAHIERCGPPLRDSFFRRAGRLRPQRHN